MRAQRADLERLDRVVQVIDRAGRRGEVQDVVDRAVDLQRVRDVVADEGEAFDCPRRCSMLARLPVMRLSTQTTSCPSARKRSHRCEPTKPAPPVMTVRTLNSPSHGSRPVRLFSLCLEIAEIAIENLPVPGMLRLIERVLRSKWYRNCHSRPPTGRVNSHATGDRESFLPIPISPDSEEVIMAGRSIRTFTVLPHLPERLQALQKLAYNMWWCWNHEAISLFRRIDDDLFEAVENSPVKLLGAIDQARLRAAAARRRLPGPHGPGRGSARTAT